MDDDLYVKLPGALVQRALALRIDIVALCSGALQAEIDRREGVATTENKPKRGRPPGVTREVRGLNLQPRIWTWLEAQKTPTESLQDAANRVLLWAMEHYPQRRDG